MTTSGSGRIEAVLKRAGEAVNASRKGLEAQAEALGLMIDQSRAALTAIGSETAENLSTNAAHIEARLRDPHPLPPPPNALPPPSPPGPPAGLPQLSPRLPPSATAGAPPHPPPAPPPPPSPPPP